jgi:hypothetical protein
MVLIHRIVDSLYRAPVLGRFFQTLGAIALLPQWRERHSTQLSAQALLLRDIALELDAARAAAASREAALSQRVDSLSNSLQVQAAVTSTVQRLGLQVKNDFEHLLPEILNAVTVQGATTGGLRVQVEDFRRKVEQDFANIAESADVVRDELYPMVISIREEVWARAGALEGEFAKRALQLDEIQSKIAVESAGRGEALEKLHAMVLSGRDELWARAGALEGELAKRVRQLDEVQAKLTALMPVPYQLNPVEISASLRNLGDSVKYLLERVEFVRRETLLEVRYGAGVGPAGRAAAEPKVIDPAKLKKAAGKLKVNVGCGHIALDGYINVDRRELPGVDVVAEANNMPFGRGTVSEFFSAHLLEHFPIEQLRREILPYWKTLLKPEGQLRAVVPDAEAMIAEYAAGRYSYSDLREVTFGGQDYDGDFHYNMFTPESLAVLLHEAGFSRVDVPIKGRRNGACYEFEVTAS